MQITIAPCGPPTPPKEGGVDVDDLVRPRPGVSLCATRPLDLVPTVSSPPYSHHVLTSTNAYLQAVRAELGHAPRCVHFKGFGPVFGEREGGELPAAALALLSAADVVVFDGDDYATDSFTRGLRTLVDAQSARGARVRLLAFKFSADLHALRESWAAFRVDEAHAALVTMAVIPVDVADVRAARHFFSVDAAAAVATAVPVPGSFTLAPSAGDYDDVLQPDQRVYVALGVCAVDAVRRGGGEVSIVTWGGFNVVAQEFAVHTALWPSAVDLHGGTHVPVPWTYFDASRVSRAGAVQAGVLAGVSHLALTHASCVLPQPAPAVSIYALRSRAQQRRILFVAACVSVLTPFSDTIVLPVLPLINTLLPGANSDSDAATVSAYMAAVGVLTLVWGPLSDKYGRRAPLLATLVGYLAFTIACIWAPTAWGLVGLRAMQGAFVGSTIVITMACVADVYTPLERGTAMGLYFVPLLVGPIVAPIVGGALADTAGWQGSFMLLAVLGAVVCALVGFGLPETQHWLMLRARRGRGAAEAAPVVEELAGLVPTPTWMAPWLPLRYIVEPALAPYLLVSALNFGIMFLGLTTLPSVISAPPYSLSTAAVGACYLPIGVSMMVGSVVGGVLSDRAGAGDLKHVTARLVPALIGALCTPAGALIYGFSLASGSLGGGLFGHVLLGVGQSSFSPGFMAYLSGVKQEHAAAASAASMAFNFVVAGVVISGAVPLQAAIGFAGLFSVAAGIHAFSLLWAFGDLARHGELLAFWAEPWGWQDSEPGTGGSGVDLEAQRCTVADEGHVEAEPRKPAAVEVGATAASRTAPSAAAQEAPVVAAAAAASGSPAAEACQPA